MSSRLLLKLEDFRLLPFLVLFSMAVGILIGNALSISDFALTPPIDALKSIAAGTFEPTVPALISLGVPIGLFAMMYPAMTNVRMGEVGIALRSPKQLGVVLFFNYLVAPFVMFTLANIFVADPELRTGLILYGLAPCIAMVIIFTFLAKGNTPMALVFVALNSVIQMLLIPVYANLLIGSVEFDTTVVAQSVVLYLGLPLVAGVLTRILVVRRKGEAGMEALKPLLNAVSILGLLFTLIVMFSLKGDLILQRPAHRPRDGDPHDHLLRPDVLRRPVRRVAYALLLSRRGRRGVQRHRPRFRDRHSHRDHGVLANGRPGDCCRSTHRGTGDALPCLGGHSPRAVHVPELEPTRRPSFDRGRGTGPVGRLR